MKPLCALALYPKYVLIFALVNGISFEQNYVFSRVMITPNNPTRFLRTFQFSADFQSLNNQVKPHRFGFAKLYKKMPLKILCLHGYRQNAEMFRQKTGSLRKVLKKYAEFYFVNAPHSLCLGDTDNNGDTTEGNADQRGWWFSRPNRNFSSRDVTDMDEGFEESLEVVKTFITTQGPFDGIMGFSQGASLAALIAALNVRNEFSLPGVKFLMLIAPFQSKSSRHGSLNATQISTPTLFICGANDNVILSSSTDDLKLQFSNLSELNHPGGHGLPASSQYKDEICGFLAKFLS